MKITTKHRIAYKRKDAPGEPMEMALYRDEVDGDIFTVTGEWVALSTGTPLEWVEDMVNGTSDAWEGFIIEPPFEPHVGMVVEDVQYPSIYFVCFIDTGNGQELSWISLNGSTLTHSEIASGLKNGSLRIREAQK